LICLVCMVGGDDIYQFDLRYSERLYIHKDIVILA
jgi:hypothetical protein